MKKMIILLLAAAMLLCLAACAPDDSDGTAAGTTEATTAATIDPNAVLGCICGANDGEDHIGRCKGEEVVWTAWSDINWPTESGYYYADHEGSEVTLDYTDYTLLLGSDDLPRDIVVDLNGKTFLVPGDEPVILDSEMTLTITDSSQGHTGIVTANQDLTQTTRHALFSLPNAEEGTTASLNIYRVTLDASAIKRGNKDGAVISVTQTNILNVYGATIKGGDVVGNGGAVYNAGTANLYDSTIYGGNVIGSDEDNQTDSSGLGGAIHTSGSLSMVDCTIHGSQAGRGGALSISGGAAVMEGGTIYGGNVTRSGGAVNIKAGDGSGASFIMRASAKGEPVIDCAGKFSNNFGAAVNVDGYAGQTHFVMECGQIIGGSADGYSGGGAVLVQDIMNDGIDGKGIFTMKGGTISGGTATSSIGQGGGNIRVTTGGVLNLYGGIITGGQDASGNQAGGIMIEGGASKVVIGGTAQITGNEGNDIFVGSGETIIINADWAGNGEKPVVISVAGGRGTFAKAADGATLTEEQKAYFTGNVTLVDNTFVLN